jgi:hypothetical protein
MGFIASHPLDPPPIPTFSSPCPCAVGLPVAHQVLPRPEHAVFFFYDTPLLENSGVAATRLKPSSTSLLLWKNTPPVASARMSLAERIACNS